MKIRRATMDDAKGIAKVHVDSWRTTYPGIMPEEVLANQSYERREQQRIRVLSQPADRYATFVAEDDGGQIIGFADAGPERSADPLYTGELYAVYLLQEAQGRGIGRTLTREVAQFLHSTGHKAMLVWVAARNPSVRFYQALGGQEIRRKQEAFGGIMLEEIAFGYGDITTLF